MRESRVYDSVGLLEEAQRYQTSIEFLELLYKELNGSGRLSSTGLGARLLTVSSALPEQFYGTDINQGSIDRAKEFIESWRDYQNLQPFKTEFDFLREKRLKPKFDNCEFYLENNFPSDLEGTFDGELASELFLHLDNPQIQYIFGKARRNLKKGGKFIFTVYIDGHPESLDKKFCGLGAKVDLSREGFIENGVVDISVLAQRLQGRNQSLYSNNKEKYWLDLSQVRVFSPKDIGRLCGEFGFKIKDIYNFKGGMFPFSYREVYFLIR